MNTNERFAKATNYLNGLIVAFEDLGDEFKQLSLPLHHMFVSLANARLRHASNHSVFLENEMADMRANGLSAKIRVIKSYKDRANVGLKEAKDAVEAWMGDNGIQFRLYQ